MPVWSVGNGELEDELEMASVSAVSNHWVAFGGDGRGKHTCVLRFDTSAPSYSAAFVMMIDAQNSRNQKKTLGVGTAAALPTAKVALIDKHPCFGGGICHHSSLACASTASLVQCRATFSASKTKQHICMYIPDVGALLHLGVGINGMVEVNPWCGLVLKLHCRLLAYKGKLVGGRWGLRKTSDFWLTEEERVCEWRKCAFGGPGCCFVQGPLEKWDRV